MKQTATRLIYQKTILIQCTYLRSYMVHKSSFLAMPEPDKIPIVQLKPIMNNLNF